MTSPHAHAHAHAADAPRPPSLLGRWPLLTGSAVGVATLAPHLFLPVQASVAYAAVVIALVGGVYFGFAVMNGSLRDQVVEFAGAGLFAVAGIVGLLAWPPLIPIAYLAHGAWDFAHHRRLQLPLVTIPAWYVPWCVVIDVIVGVGLLVLWRGNGLI